MPKRKIFIVDDHPLFRDGLSQYINAESDLMICGTAGTSAEAFEGIQKTNPDLVLMDLTLGESSGLDLLKSLRAIHETLPVLVISMHEESLYAERVLKAGARGYVMKQEASDKVMTAIRKILEGKVYLSDAMTERMLEKQVQGVAQNESSIGMLSDRELQVFQMIGEGNTTNDIAKKLHLSVKTIETYRANIKLKLGLNHNTELIQHAVQWVQTGKEV